MASNFGTPIETIDRGPWRLAAGFKLGAGDAWFWVENDSTTFPWRLKVRIAQKDGRLVCTGMRIGLDDDEVEAMGPSYETPALTMLGLRAIQMSQILDVIKAHLLLGIYQLHLPTFADIDRDHGHSGVIPEGSGPSMAELLRAKIADGALTIQRGRQPLSEQDLLDTLAKYEGYRAEGLTSAQAIGRMYQAKSTVYRRIAAARRLLEKEAP